MAKLLVKEGGTEDELIGRPCTLSVGRKTAEGFQVITRGKTSLAEREVLWKARRDNPIAEYFVTLTLEKLREIDKDPLKLKEFLASRFPRISGETTNIIVVKLMLNPGDIIKNTDREYLWDLLNITDNDVAFPPLLSWARMTQFDVGVYKEFVKEFIAMSSSYQQDKLACVIPWDLPRPDVADVISLYKATHPNVYLIDFGGKKPFDAYCDMKLGPLLRKVKELHGNRYYLYGFDIKPFKQVSDERPAENLLLLASGFNAVGPRRSRTRITKEMAEAYKKAGPRPITGRLRVFDPHDYGYHVFTDSQLLEKFGKWITSTPSARGLVELEEINEKDPKKIQIFERLGKAFNFAQQCPEALVLVKKVDEGALKKHLLSKEQAKTIVPQIEKIRRKATEKN